MSRCSAFLLGSSTCLGAIHKVANGKKHDAHARVYTFLYKDFCKGGRFFKIGNPKSKIQSRFFGGLKTKAPESHFQNFQD